MCCLTITFQFNRLHSDGQRRAKAPLGYWVCLKQDRGDHLRWTDEREFLKKQKERRRTGEASRRKCSGKGEISGKDKVAREEMLKKS